MQDARPARHDGARAVVVGAGPNGLAAAITLARAGLDVAVLERAGTVGGGARSDALTLPGFVHDTCSTVHTMSLLSPFLRELPLREHGLELVHPEAPLAHPLDGGEAVMLERSVAQTARGLGVDEGAYRRLFEPMVANVEDLMASVLGPLLRPPRHPLALARFGFSAMRSAGALGRSRFEGERARALLAGLAAHSMLSLRTLPSAAFGLVLAVGAHAVGWPIARGGTQRLANAMAEHLRSFGAVIETGRPVDSVRELDGFELKLLDLTPRGLIRLAGDMLPAGYRRRLKGYRYGPGVFKLDWALEGPIPWEAPEVARAGTVHLGGTFAEIVASEDAAARGQHHPRPFVILVQPTLFDPSRAPTGRHTGWAYCHVPSGSIEDVTEAIEAQVERFAPGFRDLIVARSALGPSEIEARNPNMVGGDINGGTQDLRQLFTRPVARLNPYSTPVDGLYICSSATPPGGGVHGMCGNFAARSALRWLGAQRSPRHSPTSGPSRP
jgi:phytoene dehydrogenase-like protein